MNPFLGDEEQRISLRAYLERIGDQVRKLRTEWVVAEIQSIRTKPAGYTELDLVDAESGKGRANGKVAKARAYIWRANKGLLARFRRDTGCELAQGHKVRLKMSARLDAQYGFSLDVEDIDPRFTLGEVEARIAEIRRTLQQRGWYELNRALRAPADFTNVAVIAPHQGAGLADFRALADQLTSAGLCAFEFFEAVFQGEAATSSIATRMVEIHDINEKARATTGSDRYDALVITRLLHAASSMWVRRADGHTLAASTGSPDNDRAKTRVAGPPAESGGRGAGAIPRGGQ